MNMNNELKAIPYGESEFASILMENKYYVDKTSFIPLLEASSKYLFFLRPRRFGKTLWLSVLQYYYDINEKDNFSHLFQNTYIGKHPTEKRNTYLIMVFNFSAVNPDTQYVKDSFEDSVRAVVQDFLERYSHFFDKEKRQEILNLKTTESQLRRIFFFTARKKLKLYFFIDEYDNFANTNFASPKGKKEYTKLTHDQGAFRFFFNLLKTATSTKGSGLDHLFITGVSPITMDDVTSGMNIGDNISLDPQFCSLVGFTESEVHNLLTYYIKSENLSHPIENYMKIIKQWHGGYRFSSNSDEVVYNSDLILYFIKEFRKIKKLPDNLMDDNIKVDYSKLRHLILVDQKLNGNFSRLKQILETGSVRSKINKSFPLEHLLDENNFISLLYYFGLLSITDVKGPRQVLSIPNLTVKKLMYSYFRETLREMDSFHADIYEFADHMDSMAYDGNWQSVIHFITEQIKSQTSVRNYLDGERAIQMFLLAYLNLTDHYITFNEPEMNKGYADIFLEPFLAKYPDLKYGYLIELKYISRKKYSKEKQDEIIVQAKDQLEKYSRDHQLKMMCEGFVLKRIVLVYKGWELVYFEEI